MRPDRPFLTARWSNLCLVSYAVPADILAPYLPPGLDLDMRDGQCFASLVAFDFLDTRVLGIRWPGLANFPEVNLRFYVREGDRRGVCFVRELVPSRIVSLVARTIYHEPYATARMRSRVDTTGDRISIHHTFARGHAEGEIVVVADGPPTLPTKDSVEHFFKEHEWGYGTGRRGKLLRYRVEHPVWGVHRIRSCEVNIDWEGLYGPEWSCLDGRGPVSVILAEGSAVKVFPVSDEAAV